MTAVRRKRPEWRSINFVRSLLVRCFTIWIGINFNTINSVRNAVITSRDLARVMSSSRTNGSFFVILADKVYVLVRTESGLNDITGCHPITDGHIADCNGLLPNAKRVSDQYVADLVASSDESTMIETSSKTQQETGRMTVLEKEVEYTG